VCWASDAGDVVLGWFTKIVVGFAIAAVVLFDTISVAAAALGTSDDADTAALAASNSWHYSHDPVAALNAATAVAAEHGETLIASSFSIASDGTVTLALRKTAVTVVLQHLGGLRKYATVTETGHGGPTN